MSTHPNTRRLVIACAGAAGLFLLIPIAIRIGMMGYLYTDASKLPHADAALILGASVVHGEPSAILAARADAAIALYKSGQVQRILVSGDNGERNYDEVTPVLRYLLAAGIPARDIFLDPAGFDTYSSMYRARHVFGARTLIILTQDFHLPRAVFLARQFGIDANGLAVEGGTAWDYLREIPATFKALLDLIVRRQPKYIGAPYPLGGKGNASLFAAS